MKKRDKKWQEDQNTVDRVTSWNSSTRFNPIVKTLCTIIVGNWRQTETIKRASSTAYRGS